MEKIKWGIIGLGKIAEKFCQGLIFSPHSELYALASPTASKEEIFRKEFQFQKFFHSYQEMLLDPEVDCIYIATPNHLHFEQSKQALLAGKHVLCEKPLCLQVSEVDELQALATKQSLFFMEALWSRFLPQFIELNNIVRLQKYGAVTGVKSTFGFAAEYDPKSRLFNPELGGGAVYDIGIYPLFLAMLCLGIPQSIVAKTTYVPTGCDLESDIELTYANSVKADLSCSFGQNMANEAFVYFEHATIRIPAMWHIPQDLYVTEVGKGEQKIAFDHIGNGYNYEAEHTALAILEKKTQSDMFSFADSRNLAEMIEQVLTAGKAHS